MSKFSLKNSLSCAWVEFIKWIVDARIVIVLCLCVFIYSFVTEPIKANAVMMGEPMNALEPFIATLNSGMVLLILPLGFLTLISDFPKIDGSTIFYIFRIGKKSWFCGQIIRLFLDDCSVYTGDVHSFCCGRYNVRIYGRGMESCSDKIRV